MIPILLHYFLYSFEVWASSFDFKDPGLRSNSADERDVAVIALTLPGAPPQPPTPTAPTSALEKSLIFSAGFPTL